MRVVTFLSLVLVVSSMAAAQAKTPSWLNGHNEIRCDLGSYHDGVDAALTKSVETLGETLVRVEVLPSFQREYSLFLQRSGGKLQLVRADFQKFLWSDLGLGRGVQRTRQECLDIAMAEKIDVVQFAVPSDKLESLLSQFNSIELKPEDCPRKGKKCAWFNDGTNFVVRTNDGRATMNEDVSRFKGVVSDNPALQKWILELKELAWNSKPQTVN